MENREFRVKKTLSGQMIQKMLWQILLFLVITVVVCGIVYFQLRRKIWHADDSGYKLLHTLNMNPWICVSLFLLWLIFGMGVILCRMVFQMIRYVDDITNGVNSIYEDTDQRLRMPRELLVVEEQLNEIRENVRKSRQTAKEAEQRKMDLIIYLAHDLKTPLTSVIGYLTILSDERELSESLQERYLNIALDKAERLEELINEFFDITRFNLSEIVLERSVVNISRMLEQMAYEFRPVFQEKNLTYRLDFNEDVRISIDSDKMSRVFDNLLRNAFYYSDTDSEIAIRLGKYEDWVSLNSEVESGRIQRLENWQYFISFENKGVTIPEEKTEKIFEQFFRMDSARSSRTGGAGLGLAIAREIVRKHGGDIICESRDGVIAFIIFLEGTVN